MTEEWTDDQITDPAFALKVLVGCWARWVRDEPFYPESTFRDFLERMSGFLGWSPDRVLDAIEWADIVLPSNWDPAEERATLDRCLEIVLGRPPAAFGPSPFELPPDPQ